MKKTSKIIVALAIIFTILAIGVMSYAADAGTLLESLDGKTGVSVEQGNITNLGNSIIAVVRIVGVVVAVVILLILGIKYMMGSVQEKAEYKRTLVPFLIGTLFIFVASTIASIIYNIAIKF